MEDRITVSIHGISKDSTSQIFYSTGHVQVWRKRVVVVKERVFLKGKEWKDVVWATVVPKEDSNGFNLYSA